jgi:hypothetical protein
LFRRIQKGLEEKPNQKPAQEAAEASITSASLLKEIQPEVTAPRTHRPAGQTVVLTILHTSKVSKAAVLDSVNFYLDFNSLLVHFPGQRKIEIKYGTGKNGDLDLSAYSS